MLPERNTYADSRIVARSEHCFVILNNAPYAPGHLMVIPYRHTGEWASLSDAALLDHAKTKNAAIAALESGMGPDGINAGENLGGKAAGGSIDDHVHTHLVPRWNGDTNFMPVLSDTKVIVESLEASYEKLHEAFSALPEATDTAESPGAVRLHFE